MARLPRLDEAQSDACIHRDSLDLLGLDWRRRMRAAYAISLVLVAAAALFVTVVALRRWDRPIEAGSRPWWLTWRRTAALMPLALAFGILGALSGRVCHGAQPMFAITFGAVLVKLGITKRWEWGEIWRRQQP